MDIGVDIIEVKRIKKLMKNKKFLNRVFSEDEIKYSLSKRKPERHFAVRFAAKEAVWKILNRKLTGLALKDITTKRDENGRPMISLPKRFRSFNKKITISLSHTENYAVAVALLND